MSYPLEQLKEFLEDAMESECTSEEIYDCLVDTVTQNMRYHKACFNTSVKLLSRLKTDFKADILSDEPIGKSEWAKYWNGELSGEEFHAALEKYGYEYTPPTAEERLRFRLDSPELHNNGDDIDLD